MWYLVIGLWIGFVVGWAMCALFTIAKLADEEQEKYNKKVK